MENNEQYTNENKLINLEEELYQIKQKERQEELENIKKDDRINLNKEYPLGASFYLLFCFISAGFSLCITGTSGSWKPDLLEPDKFNINYFFPFLFGSYVFVAKILYTIFNKKGSGMVFNTFQLVTCAPYTLYAAGTILGIILETEVTNINYMILACSQDKFILSCIIIGISFFAYGFMTFYSVFWLAIRIHRYKL